MRCVKIGPDVYLCLTTYGLQFLLAGPCRSVTLALEEPEDLHDVHIQLASAPVRVAKVELVMACGVGSLEDVVNALLPISRSIIRLRLYTDWTEVSGTML